MERHRPTTYPDPGTEASPARCADTAFEELYRRHGTLLYRYAAKLVRDPEEARDLCQDVWLRLFEYLRESPQPVATERWLRVVLRNTHLMRMRREKRRLVSFEDLEGMDGQSYLDSLPAPDETPEQVVIRRATEIWVCHGLAALGRRRPLHAAAVVGHDLLGLEYGELAGDKESCFLTFVCLDACCSARRLPADVTNACPPREESAQLLSFWWLLHYRSPGMGAGDASVTAAGLTANPHVQTGSSEPTACRVAAGQRVSTKDEAASEQVAPGRKTGCSVLRNWADPSQSSVHVALRRLQQASPSHDLLRSWAKELPTACERPVTLDQRLLDAPRASANPATWRSWRMRGVRWLADWWQAHSTEPWSLNSGSAKSTRA
jgi:RNA polymerase sigma factor (sigma-70 family)